MEHGIFELTGPIDALGQQTIEGPTRHIKWYERLYDDRVSLIRYSHVVP